MHKVLLSTVILLAIANAPALAQSDEVCPSGQINTNPSDGAVTCEPDVTVTTPAPDVVEEAGQAVKDAGAAVKDAGEAVADKVGDAVKDLTD